MKMRTAHKMVTNSNGNSASAMGAAFALGGFVAMFAWLLSLID